MGCWQGPYELRMAVDGQGRLWMNGVGGERKRKDVDRWGKLWMVGHLGRPSMGPRAEAETFSL